MRYLKYCLVFLILLMPVWAWGATVYVKKISGTVYYESGASSCDDVTNGDTLGDLEAALTAAGANGILNICNGTYTTTEIDADSRLNVPNSGVTIVGESQTGVILDGNEVPANIIYMNDKQNVTITKLTVKDATQRLILAYRDFSGIEISYVTGSFASAQASAGHGISLNTYDGIEVTNISVHHNTLSGVGTVDPLGGAIYLDCGNTNIHYDDAADDDTGDWSVIDSTLTFDTDHYEWTRTAGTQYVYRSDTTVVGMKYRFSVQVKDGTASSEQYKLKVIAGSGNIYDSGLKETSYYTSTGTFISKYLIFTATETTMKYGIYMDIGAGDIELKELKLEQGGVINGGNINNNMITGVSDRGLFGIALYPAHEQGEIKNIDVYSNTITNIEQDGIQAAHNVNNCNIYSNTISGNFDGSGIHIGGAFVSDEDYFPNSIDIYLNTCSGGLLGAGVDSAGILLDAYSRSIVVYRNILHDYEEAGIKVGYSDSNIIRFNKIYSNDDNDIEVRGSSGSYCGPASNNVISNNSIVSDGTGAGLYASGDSGEDGANIIKNNIFKNNSSTPNGIQKAAGAAITEDYNNIFNYTDNDNGFTQGGNTINSDPLFVSTINYNLAPGPCINTGTPNGSTPYSSAVTDLNGNVITDSSGDALPRFGSHLDIGAYEHKQMGNVNW